ncbi:hypothetical protein HY837_04565 [archaeon]|nr:hypothetical protein [archaeon]
MLLDLLKKTASYGLRLVSGLKYEVKSTVRSLEKEGLLSRKQAGELVNRLLKEANMERHEFQKFMSNEISKELKKAKDLAKEGGSKLSRAIKNRHETPKSKSKKKRR